MGWKVVRRKLDVELEDVAVVDANVLVVVLFDLMTFVVASCCPFFHFGCPIERCRARFCAVCVFFFKVASRAAFRNFFALVI